MGDTTQHIAKNQEATDENSVYLSDEDIIDITDALHNQDSDTIHNVLEDLSDCDAADLIAKVTDEDREELFAMYGDAIAPETFTELDPELQRQTLSTMDAAQVAAIISDLESDDALELLEPLEPIFQKEIIRKLSSKDRVALEEGLTFPEDSAGRLMQREFVAIPQFWTSGQTIDYLRQAADGLPEDFFDVFVIDPKYHVIGQIPLNKLVRADRSEKIKDFTSEINHMITAEKDQEEVADIFRRENITSAPVTDEDGRLIGVITIDDVVDVIDEEAGEDILKMAGVDQSDMYRAVLATTGTRFRWLFVNLLTAIIASIVISFFGATIEQIVALAILMPIVASMGGNAGTQALTIAVRALATKEITGTNTMRVIWKETLVGSLNGLIFALIIGLVAALWFQNDMLGIVIALAMTINLVFAGFFGASIPIWLNRTGNDPAVSSTVLLTTITDVVGFLAFLGLATLLL